MIVSVALEFFASIKTIEFFPSYPASTSVCTLSEVSCWFPTLKENLGVYFRPLIVNTSVGSCMNVLIKELAYAKSKYCISESPTLELSNLKSNLLL